MSLRFTSVENVTALFDSVSGWAFGPTFGSAEEADLFLTWCERQGVDGGDVRAVNLATLEQLWDRYTAEQAEKGDE